MALLGDSPGTRLGKYQLLRRLATGGMAELFLARAQAIHGFEKLVVLKRILPQHAQSEDFIRMFLAEARLAAKLHHPNVAQVYDIGEQVGTYFFTMEYVQGQDLRRLVRAARRKQTPIPLEHILHIIMGMAGGLHHAHEKVGTDGRPLGIVHRDVSPSNVLVTYEGDVKVVDFGIAKAATAQVSTIAGTLKGKIPYMSPEQCRGEVVDRRSDIFSIGTLLWELTTGKRLFAGENEFAILNRVAKADVPPPSSIRPEYPPELEAIVMRALQCDPDHRYSSAIDLQIDLEDFAREARLPVSSARMGRFMRSLFDDEIKAAAAELQVDVGPEPEEVPGGTLIVTPSSPPEGYSDLTPSEVRLHGEPTPGLVQEEYSGGSGTDISMTDSVPGRGRGPALALGAGFLLTVGLGGGLWVAMAGNAEPLNDPAEAAGAAPMVLEAPAVEAEFEAAPSDPPAKSHPAVDPSDADADADAAAADGPGLGAAGSETAPGAPAAADEDEADADGAADAASAADEETKPTAGERGPSKGSPSKPRRGPRTRKKTAKPAADAESKAKKSKNARYDENSARLPGL